MKILFVTPVVPSNSFGGGVYTNSIIKAFKSLLPGVKIDLLVLSDHRKKKSRFLRILVSFFNYIFSGVPITVGYHRAFIDCERIKSYVAPYDLIVVDHLESGQVMIDAGVTDYIYVAHNIEHQLLISKLLVLLETPFKYFVNGVVLNLKKYEDDFLSNSEGVVSISKDDAEYIASLNGNVEVVYPLFDDARCERMPHSSEEIVIGFLGGSNWHANRLAVMEIYRNILPEINRPFRFFLAGSGWEEYVADKNIDNDLIKRTTFLGYLDSLKPFWSSIDVFLSPILTGAGTNIKVCEALYHSVPVFGSRHSFRGLDDHILNMSDIFIGDSHELALKLNSCKSFKYFDVSSAFKIDPATQAIGRILNKKII